MNSPDARGVGDRAAVIGLVAVGAVFSLIVGYGWSRLFAGTGAISAIIVGLIASAIALGLAYFVAAIKHEAGRWALTAILPFSILFAVSALGTLNTLFSQFQAQKVVQEEARVAKGAVIALRKIAETPPEAERAFRSEVRALWGSLKDEIVNPNRCGQGPEASMRLRALQEKLPTFQLLSGLNCSTASATIPYYEKRIRDLEEAAPVVLQSKPDSATRSGLEGKAREIEAMLDKAESLAAPGAAYESIRLAINMMAVAASKYSALRREAEGAAPGIWAGVPDVLNTDQSEKIGNPGQVIPFMLARLADVSTYIFILAALAMDLAMVSAFGGVLRRGPQAYRVRPASLPERL